MAQESRTQAALRRGAETVSVCRCEGAPIRQPGGCFTCGKPRRAPRRPEMMMPRWTPPESLPAPHRETVTLPLHLRDVGNYLGRFC